MKIVGERVRKLECELIIRVGLFPEHQWNVVWRLGIFPMQHAKHAELNINYLLIYLIIKNHF